MELSFLEELICAYNPKLKYSDLEKLDKLSYLYDVYNCINNVFNDDFVTIVNKLVINELPYSIASKLLFNDKLVNNFIDYQDGKFFVDGELWGRRFVKEHVDRINKILQDET